ncbi:hypothetical protein C3L33_19457, partial [Rhododendron williamsianum]
MSKMNSSSSELDLDRPNIEDYLPYGCIQEPNGELRLRDLLDISPTLTEAAGAIVDVDEAPDVPHFPIPRDQVFGELIFFVVYFGFDIGVWGVDMVLVLTIGWIIFLSAYFPVHLLLKGHDKLRKKLERGLVELICSFFVASWTGVVKYHGPRPSMRPKQVFVSNHTSMIDFIILEQMTAFAVLCRSILDGLDVSGSIAQRQRIVKLLQESMFRLRDHVQGADNNPLLIFPEGTCVNNHYTVMFKKGAFELGCTVCPIAIKYNKIFVDAFWNSRKVRDIISVRAGLKKVPWDGYLKYSRPSPKHREMKQQSFAESVLRRLEYPRLAISKYKVAAFHSITLVLNKDLSQDTAGLFGATPEQL